MEISYIAVAKQLNALSILMVEKINGDPSSHSAVSEPSKTQKSHNN